MGDRRSGQADPVSQLNRLWHYACVGSPLESPVAYELPASSPALDDLAGCRRHLLQRVFYSFDQNNDGLLSAQEISTVFQALELPRDGEATRPRLLAGPGTTPTGHIDKDEFCLLYDSISATTPSDEDSYLWEAFRVFDKDGNGFISPAELQSVLCSLGFAQASQVEACVEMIARVDENADGQVDFFEFQRLFQMESASRLIAA